MQYLEYFIFRLFVKLFSILPFSAIYFLSDILHFILFRLIKYRYAVIRQNLQHAFPEKAPEEIRGIIRAFYRNLSDIMVEAAKGVTLSREELESRFKIHGAEHFRELFQQGKSIILTASHFTNWEWGALAVNGCSPHKVIGIYKPINNPKIAAYLNTLRGQWGLQLRNMQQTGRALIEFRNQPSIFCLIADQTPSNLQSAHWVNFLNQDTPFLPGPEKIARRTGYPVFYFHTQRIRRGYYESTILPLNLEPAGAGNAEITRAYALLLEEFIMRDPPYWLWSHRRWKKSRTRKAFREKDQ